MHSTHKCLIACVVSVTSGTAFVTPSLQVAVERSRTHRSFLFRKDGESLECSTRRDIFVQAITASAFLIPTAAQAMYIDPVTRIVLPSEGEIQSAIPNTFYDNPFEDLDKSSFGRLDQTPDTIFYKDPRFTEHVDENAVQTMTRFISNDILKQNDSVLDLCSSWTSHIDKSAAEKLGLQRISGLGMNEEELKANTALNDYTLVDLNANPNVVLPYGDSSFDVVLCQLLIFSRKYSSSDDLSPVIHCMTLRVFLAVDASSCCNSLCSPSVLCTNSFALSSFYQTQFIVFLFKLNFDSITFTRFYYNIASYGS